MKQVFICGGHSTGKTTLFNNLQEKLLAENATILYSDEVARRILLQSNITAETQKDKEFFKKLNLCILQEQNKREEEMRKLSELESTRDETLCVFDRGILDPICYLSISIGKEFALKVMAQEFVSSLVKRLQNKQESIVFVMKPFQKYCVNDNIRVDTDDFNDLVIYDEVMKSLMRSLNIQFHYIEDEDLPERTEFIVEVLSEQWPGLKLSTDCLAAAT